MPWYRLRENLARVHRFYDQEAWETLVSEAETLDKQALIDQFGSAQREAAELHETEGPLSADQRNRMGQIYYSAKLHYHLMEFSDEARIGFERLKQQMRRTWPHNEDPARLEEATASGEEGQGNSDDESNDGGSGAATVSVPDGFFGDANSEHSGRGNETVTDQKVQSVFNELKRLTMDADFEPTNPLTELLRDFSRGGGLLEHETFVFGHLLTRFKHQRLRELRGLIENHQARWGTPLMGKILRLVCDIDQNFGDYTEVSSQATSTVSSTSGSRRNSELNSQDFQEPIGTQPNSRVPREASYDPYSTSQQRSAAEQTTPSPPRHLRPTQPIPAPFSRFHGMGMIRQNLVRSDGGPRNLYESPFGRQVAEPAPGPRPALRAFDIPPQPRTTNPFRTMLGLTSSGPGRGEFIGFGSTERRADGGRSRNAERGERAHDRGEWASERDERAHDRGERAPERDERAPDHGAEWMPGAERRRGDDDRDGDPPGGAGTAPVAGAAAASGEINPALLQILDKLTNQVVATTNPAARSSTRIKFPDFKCSHFDGDPMKFLPWIMEFTEMLRLDEHLGEHAKLTLLKMHLTASVKTELNFTTADTMGYENCLELLTSKYGRPVQIKRAYRRKISDLPAPANNFDYKGLDKMVRECKQLLNALDRIGQRTEEIGVTVVDVLLDKLPARMYGEVNTFTYNQTGRDPRDLDISDLLMVLETFAQLQEDVDHHNKSRSAGTENNRSREQRGEGRHRGRNQRANDTTDHRQSTMVTTGAGAGTAIPYCALCQSREHWAEKCKQYETPTQRRERFVELKLCFKCAKAHPGGVRACTHSYSCGAQLKDNRCTRNHHLALHDYYTSFAPAGPPQGGDNGGRHQRGERGDNGGRPQRGDNASRGRSTSPSPRVRFVDEKDRGQTHGTASGNGRRRE